MLDPIAAVTHPDPYPYYAQLAQRDVLERHGALWVAASAPLVTEVMQHPACRVRPPAEPVPAALSGGSAADVFGALVRMNDGARHAAPKLALQRALAALPLPLVAQRAAHIAGGLLDELPLGQWAFEAPVRTVASLLGFADAQLPALARWMGQFVACLSPLSSAEQIDGAHAASLQLLAAFRELLQAPPEGTLLAAVAQEAHAAGWRDDHAILANLVGLLSQTYEATAGLLGNSLLAWRGEGDAAALVHDVARNDPPIQNTRRFVAEAAHIGSVRVEAGQAILLVLAAASRDPRADGRVFGFGHGLHACPGQAMAAAIATAALECAIRRGIRPQAWRYRPSVNARIPEFL